MPLHDQKQVLRGLDELSARSMRAVRERYRTAVTQPLLDAVESAGEDGSLEGLLRKLGPGCLDRMDPAPVAEALAETLDQAAGIGAVSATRKDSKNVVQR